MKIKLGDIAKETITGFEGVVIGHTKYLSNCDRFTIAPQALHDGKPIASRSFDVGLIQKTGESDKRVIPVDRPAEPVQLGDRVRNQINGFEGIVTAITFWSEGCVNLQVQSVELKDGLPRDPEYFDERTVDVIESANPKPKAVRTGGPRPEPRRPR